MNEASDDEVLKRASFLLDVWDSDVLLGAEFPETRSFTSCAARHFTQT